MIKVSLLALGLCVASPSFAQREPVSTLGPLLVRAIDSPTGTASARLVGNDVERLAAYFQTREGLLVDVSTQKRYRQPGCSRLRVDFRQKGVMLPGKTQPEDKYVGFALNYCRDGKPPRSLE